MPPFCSYLFCKTLKIIFALTKNNIIAGGNLEVVLYTSSSGKHTFLLRPERSAEPHFYRLLGQTVGATRRDVGRRLLVTHAHLRVYLSVIGGRRGSACLQLRMYY